MGAEAQVYLSLGEKEMREIGVLQDEMVALKWRARSGQDTSLEERALVSKMYNQLAVHKVCCTQQSLMSIISRMPWQGAAVAVATVPCTIPSYIYL